MQISKSIRFYTIILAGAAFLAGCGIKPGAVEPPEGTESSTFPRTYPDVSTDPQHAEFFEESS